MERSSIDTEAIRAGSSRDYVPALENTRCSLWSSRVLQTADMAAVARARRRNYEHWLSEVETLDGCAPLFGALDEQTVPYMFPLILENPDCQFDALKRLGMPMFRWDALADSDCLVSSRYRTGLVHLPCHQGIDADMLAQLVDILRQGLANAIDRKAVA
ncbi:MAG: hypothetical protein U5K33_06750 [Halofilum sp. (in: g-proteobacteria)]|nr:hypothetical protein [Halofilum sp. (in: g-proteobacteria)]